VFVQRGEHPIVELVDPAQHVRILNADQHHRLEAAAACPFELHRVWARLPTRTGDPYDPIAFSYVVGLRYVEHTAGFGQPERIGVFVQHVGRHAVGVAAITGTQRLDLETVRVDAEQHARAATRVDRALRAALGDFGRMPRRSLRRALHQRKARKHSRIRRSPP
jgi:hypothetical protein